jgi:hypothetical protein
MLHHQNAAITKKCTATNKKKNFREEGVGIERKVEDQMRSAHNKVKNKKRNRRERKRGSKRIDLPFEQRGGGLGGRCFS